MRYVAREVNHLSLETQSRKEGKGAKDDASNPALRLCSLCACYVVTRQSVLSQFRLGNLLFSRSSWEDYFVRSLWAMVCGGRRITLCDGWSQARNDLAFRVRWAKRL